MIKKAVQHKEVFILFPVLDGKEGINAIKGKVFIESLEPFMKEAHGNAHSAGDDTHIPRTVDAIAHFLQKLALEIIKMPGTHNHLLMADQRNKQVHMAKVLFSGTNLEEIVFLEATVLVKNNEVPVLPVFGIYFIVNFGKGRIDGCMDVGNLLKLFVKPLDLPFGHGGGRIIPNNYF
ncbi:hypothetical protein [Paraflavisolibacter sp. H34]|uniref:hypothetical protein n=1 Tax=Huijunlia imazamoxiresistens TaxID=3127457 RepID=UPI00301A0428